MIIFVVLSRQSMVSRFINRPRCEMWPIFLYLHRIRTNNVIFIIQPVPLRNAAGFLIWAIFRAIPDLAVFRRFPGLSPVGWYKLSSGP